MRSAVVLVIAVSGITGCALVSGLSGLDVAPDPFDASVLDAQADAPVGTDAIADTKADVADASFDAVSVPDAAKDADAGACPIVGSDPAAIATTCTTGSPIFAAGTIPTAAYSLTQLREFPATCTGYVPVQATGLLLVTATSSSSFSMMERLTINGVTTSRYYTATMSGTTMTVTLVCGPPIPSNTWQLNVSAQGAKTSFVVYKASPPVDQRFFWTQQ